MNLSFTWSNHLEIHCFTTAGSDKAEVRHQNVETHTLQIKDQNTQTEIVQIKDQQVQAESTTQQQGIKTASVAIVIVCTCTILSVACMHQYKRFSMKQSMERLSVTSTQLWSSATWYDDAVDA